MGRVVLGSVEVDLAARRACGEGGEVRLTALEAEVLRYLAERPDTDVPREELLANVWGNAPGVRSRAVDLVVSRLRQKLGEGLRERLLTSHGLGYRLVMGQGTRTEVAQGRPAVRLPHGQLDLDRRRFVPDRGEPAELSLQEATVVELLLGSRGLVERDRIERALWRHASADALQALLQRLKRKLGEALVVRRGLGVQLLRVDQRTNLPPSPDLFLERSELEELQRALSRCRAVVLRGPAGVGKTRLALELGHRLLVEEPELQVWWVPLSGALGAGSFLYGVARALQLELGPDPAAQLGRALSARSQTLLVLDNLEQLVDQAPVLEAWLAQAPGVRFLLTSRCSLPLPAHEVTLQPLPLQTALALFAARAAAFPWVSPEPQRVRKVVERLDGLPLAIELAAARVEQLAQLEDRLEQRLDLLGQGRSSLRGALDWSWALLGEPEQEQLLELCLFSGPIPSALAGEPEALCAHSLVQQTPEGFVLADTIRLYARERLAQRPDRGERARRWADRLLAHARTQQDGLGQERSHRDSLRELRALHDDLRSLLVQAPEPEQRTRAGWDLVVLGKYGAPQLQASELVPLQLSLGTSCDAEVLLGAVLQWEDDFEGALRHAAMARELVRQPSDMTNVLRLSATVHRYMGQRAQALAEFEQARALARAHGLHSEEIKSCVHLSTVLHELSEFAESLALVEEAEALSRTLGRLDLLQDALEKRAHTLMVSEQWQQALQVAIEATELAARLDSPRQHAYGLSLQGMAWRELGGLDRAEQLFDEAEAELRRVGYVDHQQLWLRALVTLERGDAEGATRLFERAAAQYGSPEHTFLVAYSRYQAIAEITAGEPQRAIDRLRALEPAFLARIPEAAHAHFHGYFAVALALADQPDEARHRLLRARRSPSLRPSVEPFLGLAEALVAGDRQQLGQEILSLPRGDSNVRFLLQICERATRRAPARPGSPGTGGPP
jgi:DNA-binding response OmpR family regulator